MLLFIILTCIEEHSHLIGGKDWAHELDFHTPSGVYLMVAKLLFSISREGQHLC